MVNLHDRGTPVCNAVGLSQEFTMTWIIDRQSRRQMSAKLMAGLAISALLAVGSFAAPANAASADQQNLPYGYGRDYAAPPVAHGSPHGYGYYSPPYGYYCPPHRSYWPPYHSPPGVFRR